MWNKVKEEFAEIEQFEPMQSADRVRPLDGCPGQVFEVGLHMFPEGAVDDLRNQFVEYPRSPWRRDSPINR